MNYDKLAGDLFGDFVRRARERFGAMSPEEQRAHLKAQARSFVKGNLELSGIEFDEEAFERAYERSDR